MAALVRRRFAIQMLLAAVRDQIAYQQRFPRPPQDLDLADAADYVSSAIPLETVQHHLCKLVHDRSETAGWISTDAFASLCLLIYQRHDAIRLLNEIGYSIENVESCNTWEIIKIVLAKSKMYAEKTA